MGVYVNMLVVFEDAETEVATQDYMEQYLRTKLRQCIITTHNLFLN